MDDSQCRLCLAEVNDSCFSVFDQDNGFNGVTIAERIEFVTGVKIADEDNFSKILCDKCYNDTSTSYNLKKKCLETDRTLKTLELKFQKKLKEKVDEILHSDQPLEYVDNALGSGFAVVVEEDQEIFEIYEEEPDVQEALQTDELYEEVEFLDNDAAESEADVESVYEMEDVKSNSKTLGQKNICTYPELEFQNEDIYLKDIAEDPQLLANDAQLTCTICNYTFDNNLEVESMNRSMAKHLAAHKAGKKHSCVLCPDVFKTHNALERHQALRHFKCKSCQTEFPSTLKLHDHLKTSGSCKEIQEKPFKCFICFETFAMGIKKKKHIQMDHQDKAGADCPLCIRCKIPSAVAFENHYKTHFEAPRFCCSFCAKTFHESDRLQTHIRRFHQISKLCCDYCEKTFRDKSGISRHILGVHLNRRDHKCEFCSKTFTANYNLKEHLFSVHKEASKFYTCELCHLDFLYRKQFERHRKACSGVASDYRRR